MRSLWMFHIGTQYRNGFRIFTSSIQRILFSEDRCIIGAPDVDAVHLTPHHTPESVIDRRRIDPTYTRVRRHAACGFI